MLIIPFLCLEKFKKGIKSKKNISGDLNPQKLISLVLVNQRLCARYYRDCSTDLANAYIRTDFPRIQGA